MFAETILLPIQTLMVLVTNRNVLNRFFHSPAEQRCVSFFINYRHWPFSEMSHF
jgi:hypothetical protein